MLILEIINTVTTILRSAGHYVRQKLLVIGVSTSDLFNLNLFLIFNEENEVPVVFLLFDFIVSNFHFL